MRIRSSVLTPILAVLTVAAILTIGVVLEQVRQGHTGAAMPGSVSMAMTSPADDIAAVADSESIGGGNEQTEQPVLQTIQVVRPSVVGSAPGQPGVSAGDQSSASQPASKTRHSTTTEHTVKRTTTTVHSADDGSTAADDGHAGSDSIDAEDN